MYTGLCLSDPHYDRAGDGSKIRTLSAAHFAGRYRLVDFMLSNMVNSKIYTIGIVLNSQYQSLINHIGMGKEWDLARKSGGVTFFPPYLDDGRQGVNDEPDGPLLRLAEYIMQVRDEYVVLADSSVAYNMDYRDAIETHKESGADITAVYSKKTITPGECEGASIFDISDDGRVRAVSRASFTNEKLNVSLGVYIMRKGYFLQLTSGEKNCGMLKFSRSLIAGALDRLSVMAYEFKGYSVQICSMETFFHYNMEMLDEEKRNSLFDYEGRRIFTNRRDSLPTKYGKKAEIKNSIIADGCQIDGTVINSVICRNVKIREDAVVRNCILQDDTMVDRHCMLDYIITDRNVIISEHRSMIGNRSYPVYIERARIV